METIVMHMCFIGDTNTGWMDMEIVGPYKYTGFGKCSVFHVESSTEKIAKWVSYANLHMLTIVRGNDWTEKNIIGILGSVLDACAAPIIMFSGDLLSAGDIAATDAVADRVYHIRIEDRVPPVGTKFPGKYLPYWGMINPNTFYPAKKTIELSMIGTLRGRAMREACVATLQNDGIDIFLGGGEIHNDTDRQTHLSPDQYCSAVRSSRFVLNATQDRNAPQIKRRVWEALACKSLLFEYDNPATRRYIEPGKEYVPFDHPAELPSKIRYYRKHSDEADRIAQAGYERWRKDYNPCILWRSILNRFCVA
jgi:hypothetical protein